MRDEKDLRIYGALALVGLAMGAMFFSQKLRRSNGRRQCWLAERNDSRADSGLEQDKSPVQDHGPATDTSPDVSAVGGPSPALRSTQAEVDFPAAVVTHASGNNEEHLAERQIVRLETTTSQASELASVAAPTAAWYRVHDWIQTGCAVLVVILIVFFGVTLSRRLQALTEAQHDSQSASRAAQQLTRSEQRPWVGMIDAVPLPLRPDGGGFTIKVQNTGLTPAYDVQFSGVIMFADNDSLSEDQIPEMAVMTPLGPLVPGASYTTGIFFRTSPRAILALVNRQQRAVGVLRMTYTDAFKTPHSSRACFYWFPDLKTVKPCETLNDIN